MPRYKHQCEECMDAIAEVEIPCEHRCKHWYCQDCAQAFYERAGII